ncbi:MAG: type I glyceraldehyde-3-phosphate dehydrogenase [Candidatus Pacebacteria bacterium]|nr:type I glyceraldehyde-3-phosphate dehydrogenase [Candidatus Paceibacterota bacterium]
MPLKIAINGFGRIGRMVVRAILESKRKDIQVLAINSLNSIKGDAYLLQYDSVHGILPERVVHGDSFIQIGDQSQIRMVSQREPQSLPWRELGVDIVLECTGKFTKRELAMAHIAAGAKRVLISAPADDADLTVVYGVNHDRLNAQSIIVSNASCTTNCLAPIAKILHEAIGIETGYMTTVHSYTGDQSLVDTSHKDLRRSRAAALSMIPTSTGAARAIGVVLPQLKGRLDGVSIRVPTANVSLVDLVFNASRDCTAEEINGLAKAASESAAMKGVLAYSTEELVSIDFNHHPASSIFDATQTAVIGKRLVHINCWYDNEWGFSNRMLDTAVAMGQSL